MTWALAINILVAIGGLAGLSSLLTVLLSKNKVKAEASDIEQNVSDKILKNVNSDNEQLRKERDALKGDVELIRTDSRELRDRMEKYEWDQYETRMLIIRLLNWAKAAGEELHKGGSTLESPPIQELLVKLNIKV